MLELVNIQDQGAGNRKLGSNPINNIYSKVSPFKYFISILGGGLDPCSQGGRIKVEIRPLNLNFIFHDIIFPDVIFQVFIFHDLIFHNVIFHLST